jgi:hypothetical protein
MQRIRNGGPQGVVRPFLPSPAAGTDVEAQKADALEHIARALSALDHNVEVLTNRIEKQNEILAALVQTIRNRS